MIHTRSPYNNGTNSLKIKNFPRIFSFLRQVLYILKETINNELINSIKLLFINIYFIIVSLNVSRFHYVITLFF